jgi:hypothetical protein
MSIINSLDLLFKASKLNFSSIRAVDETKQAIVYLGSVSSETTCVTMVIQSMPQHDNNRAPRLTCCYDFIRKEAKQVVKSSNHKYT